MKTFIFAAFFAFVSHGHTCVQRMEEVEPEPPISVMLSEIRLKMQPMEDYWAKFVDQRKSRADFAGRNDFAVGLMHSGRAAEAIHLLEALEEEKPGTYEVAANLGTAFELTGNNSLALKWIREGLKRNPDSHQGSEWVHVKILETKIKAATSPETALNTSIIPLNFSKLNKNSSRAIFVQNSWVSARQVREAIFYQLKERVQFVKPEDFVVADLISTLAQIEAKTTSIKAGRELFSLAAEYGFNGPKADGISAQFSRAIFWGTVRITLVSLIVISLAGFVGLQLLRKFGIK